MGEIRNNKLTTVSYLAKVLTPIVTVIKSVETKVMALLGLPTGGTAGQILAKATDADGSVEWVDPPAGSTDTDEALTQLEQSMKSYVDDTIEQELDDGEL